MRNNNKKNSEKKINLGPSARISSTYFQEVAISSNNTIFFFFFSVTMLSWRSESRIWEITVVSKNVAFLIPKYKCLGIFNLYLNYKMERFQFTNTKVADVPTVLGTVNFSSSAGRVRWCKLLKRVWCNMAKSTVSDQFIVSIYPSVAVHECSLPLYFLFLLSVAHPKSFTVSSPLFSSRSGDESSRPSSRRFQEILEHLSVYRSWIGIFPF